jgi:hypothetical protein
MSLKPEILVYVAVFLLCASYFIFPQYQKDAISWIGLLTPFGNELGLIGWVLFGLMVAMLLVFGAVALLLYGVWSKQDVNSISLFGFQPWGVLDGLEKSLDSFHLDVVTLVICVCITYFGALVLENKFDVFGKDFGSVLVVTLGLFFLIKIILSAFNLEKKANDFLYSLSEKD